jgi:hypothetical protein
LVINIPSGISALTVFYAAPPRPAALARHLEPGTRRQPSRPSPRRTIAQQRALASVASAK